MYFSLPRGMRDLDPDTYEILEKIRFEFMYLSKLFGFKIMEPSPIETLGTLEAKSGQSIKDEIYYFKDKGNIENSLSFSSSLDYSTKNGFYFLGSYLYNSNGMNESNFLSLININANVLSPKNLMPSKHSYLLQVNKPISPPLNMSLNILYGKGIKLLYVSPSLSYDISSNLDAGVIVQYFYLDNFGDFKNLLKGYYLQLKYSF